MGPSADFGRHSSAHPGDCRHSRQNASSPTYTNIPVIKVPEEGQKLVELIKKQLEKPQSALTKKMGN